MVSSVDADLSDYFSIIVDDANDYTLFSPKIGELRVQDPDDTGNTDYFQFTNSPALGGLLQKTSCITDKSIWQLQATGTIDGTLTTRTLKYLDLDLDALILNDAAANAITVTAENIDLNGATLTSIGLSGLYGINIDLPVVTGFATAHGLYITTNTNDMVVDLVNHQGTGIAVSGDVINTTKDWVQIKPSAANLIADVTNKFINVDLSALTITDGANLPILVGLNMDLDGITEADVGGTILYAINIDMPDVPASYSAIAGLKMVNTTRNMYSFSAIYGNYDSIDVGNADLAIINQYNNAQLGGNITADRAVTSWRNYYRLQAVNSSTGDFDLDVPSTGGVMSLAYSHTCGVTGASAKTDYDEAYGTILDIAGEFTTNTHANSKLVVDSTLLDLSYTLTETVGDLRLGTDVDMVYLSATIPAGVASTGAASSIDMFEINGGFIELNSADFSFTMLKIDATNLTNTTSSAAYVERLIGPNDSNVSSILSIEGNMGNANLSQRGLVIQENLQAAITADRAVSNYRLMINSEQSNTSAGDFDLTDDATSGLVNLVLGHTAATTVGAKTNPDVLTGNVLNISVYGTTNTNANTKLDVGATALNINYTLTETLGTLRYLPDVNIAKITAVLPAGITTSAATSFDMLELNADGVVLNDAALNFIAFNVDATDLTNTLSALATLVKLTAPDDSNLDTLLSLYGIVGNCNLDQRDLVIQSGIQAAITADRVADNFTIMANNEYNNTSAGDFDLTDSVDSGGVNVVLGSICAVTVGAKTDPDVLQGSASRISVYGITSTANSKLDVTAKALDIDYALTETAGILRMGETDMVYIGATIPAGVSATGAVTVDMLEINADAVVLNDANFSFELLNLDASGLTNTASAALKGLQITMPAASTGAAPVGLTITTNAVTDTALTTNGEIVAGNLAATQYMPFEYMEPSDEVTVSTTTEYTTTIGGVANTRGQLVKVLATAGAPDTVNINFQYQVPADYKTSLNLADIACNIGGFDALGGPAVIGTVATSVFKDGVAGAINTTTAAQNITGGNAALQWTTLDALAAGVDDINAAALTPGTKVIIQFSISLTTINDYLVFSFPAYKFSRIN